MGLSWQKFITLKFISIIIIQSKTSTDALILEFSGYIRAVLAKPIWLIPLVPFLDSLLVLVRLHYDPRYQPYVSRHQGRH